MSDYILVTYASRYGSTAGVAEVIASTLRSSGLQVELAPVNAVGSIWKYQAIIIGAPLFVGQWHQDMHKFLTTHQVALQQKPVAIFTLGPIHIDVDEMNVAKASVHEQLGKYNWLNILDSMVFVGKYDPEKLTGIHKIIAKFPASPLRDMPLTDNRNWYAIRSWAQNMAEQFLVLGHPAHTLLR